MKPLAVACFESNLMLIKPFSKTDQYIDHIIWNQLWHLKEETLMLHISFLDNYHKVKKS